MAEDKEPFEALTATQEHTAEQITKQLRGRWRIILVGLKDHVSASLD